MSLLSALRDLQLDRESASFCGGKIRLPLSPHRLFKLTLRITHFFSSNFGNFQPLFVRISIESSHANKLGKVSILFCMGVRLGLAHEGKNKSQVCSKTE